MTIRITQPFDYFDYSIMELMIEVDIEGATPSIISSLDMIVTTLVETGQASTDLFVKFFQKK